MSWPSESSLATVRAGSMVPSWVLVVGGVVGGVVGWIAGRDLATGGRLAVAALAGTVGAFGGRWVGEIVAARRLDEAKQELKRRLSGLWERS